MDSGRGYPLGVADVVGCVVVEVLLLVVMVEVGVVVVMVVVVKVILERASVRGKRRMFSRSPQF